MTMKVTDN